MKKLIRKKIKIGYKKASGEYIVKLQILGKNNEKRENVSDPIHAKYRCSKVKVLDIFHWKTGEKINSISGLCDPNFIYTLNQTIETNFDEDLENVCSTGIHYFKTLEQAKYWNFFPFTAIVYKYTGECKEWDDRGDLILHCFYKDGKLHGECKEWNQKGRLITHCFYKDGKLHGEYKKWNHKGKLIKNCFYENGKRLRLRLNFV